MARITSGFLAHLRGDARALFLARSMRMFAFGSTGVVLAVFLHALGLDDLRMGLLLTLTLLGDVALSLPVTLLADRVGRRRVLLVGCALLVAAGAVFARAIPAEGRSFWVLVAAATIGVLSPSGNEVGPFMALEQAVLSDVVPMEARTEAFAWYNLIGYFSTAAGAAEAGALVDWLSLRVGFSTVGAFRAVFVQYALLGGALAAVTALLSSRIEAGHEGEPGAGGPGGYAPLPASPGPERALRGEHDQQRLLPGGAPSAAASQDVAVQQLEEQRADPPPPPPPRQVRKGLLGLSPRSLRIVAQLSVLFSIDSFAGSLINGTLLSYYFSLTYGASPSYLGALLFGANVIAGISSLASGHIAARIGLVNTMVFTHLPSNLLLIAVPLMPTLGSATAMVFLRFTLSQMDVAPRTSYVAGVVRPSERAATLGLTNIAKTLAAAGGPLVTGHLAAIGHYGWAFFLCGGLKIAYDLALLYSFRHIKPDAELVLPVPMPVSAPVPVPVPGVAGGTGGAARGEHERNDGTRG